jgi:hypothetical protein
MQIHRNDSLIIESVNKYVFRNGNVFETFETKNTGSKVYFDKNTQNPVALLFHSTTGELIEYNFKDNELEYKTICFEHNGISSTKEIISYSSSEIDYSNSAFIVLEKLNETDSNWIVNVQYKGAYSFVSGYIVVGEKIFNRGDALKSKLPKFNMVSRTLKIEIPKRYFENNIVSLSIFIERGIDREIKYCKTFPGDGRNSFNETYIKEFTNPKFD